MNDTEKKPGVVGNLTLAQRIDRIIESVSVPLQVEVVVSKNPNRQDAYYPISQTDFCVVCGMRCFDADPTGVTCGNLRCLAALPEIIQEAEEAEAKEEMGNIEQTISEIAELIGVDSKSFAANLTGLLKRLKTEIQKIIGGIEELETST